MIKLVFWILLFIIFYSYIGYGILIWVLIFLKKILFIKKKSEISSGDYEPDVTLFIAAYNEKHIIPEKIKNCFELDYPKEKLKFLWITDGSDDGSVELLEKYKEISVLHQPERKGKISAVNRGMKFVKTPIVVFSDANTFLNKEAIREIVKHFTDKKVGCVAGEKRIFTKKKEAASGVGEAIYWRYESTLKKLDTKLYSSIGAMGELFAIRTGLYEEIESDIIAEDFVISMRIALKGYKIYYTPDAFAIETPSANIKEEFKRKVRISAGGLQAILRLKEIFNPLKNFTLSFQFISHKVLRLSLAPLALLLIIPINLIILYPNNGLFHTNIYSVIFFVQLIFYFFVSIGYFFQNQKMKFKILFIPYYIFIMNLSLYLGFFRLIRGRQSVIWEKAQRDKS